jgi:hypothetical protein
MDSSRRNRLGQGRENPPLVLLAQAADRRTARHQVHCLHTRSTLPPRCRRHPTGTRSAPVPRLPWTRAFPTTLCTPRLMLQERSGPAGRVATEPGPQNPGCHEGLGRSDSTLNLSRRVCEEPVATAIAVPRTTTGVDAPRFRQSRVDRDALPDPRECGAPTVQIEERLKRHKVPLGFRHVRRIPHRDDATVKPTRPSRGSPDRTQSGRIALSIASAIATSRSRVACW